MQFVRTNDDPFVDEIRTRVVPRYKTSDLSGDEWRFHVEVDLLRKGDVLTTRRFQNFRDAAAYLPWWMSTWDEDDSLDVDRLISVMSRHDGLCHQYGCARDATVVYRLITRYCDAGHRSENPTRLHRAFCDVHATRGDCGLDDADRNYEIVDGITTDDVDVVTRAIGVGVVSPLELAQAGLRPWDESQPVLWLFPAWWRPVIPVGMSVTSIDGSVGGFDPGSVGVVGDVLSCGVVAG